MKLSQRDKIVHLLNRFGLGANEREIEFYMPMGVDGAIDHLINYDKVPNDFKFTPWEFMYEPDGKVNADVSRVALWWVLRMITTQRPMEEKLTLFWHNHFAVSGAKVEFGPMMYGYLDTLRNYGMGDFGTLLDAVAKTPAMLRWLDTDRSLKGRPNENFGRELMELFTLGIGNYTEKDVQHASRSFSGWSIRFPIYEMGKMPEPERMSFAIDHDMPMAAFQDSPDLHDNGMKTVLGVTAPLTAEDILKMMAHHQATAHRMTKKMWEWFVYQNPEPQVVDRMAKVWTKSGLDIKQTLLAMAHSKEFWSDRAIGTMVKSPIDFTIGALRQVDAGPALAARRMPYASYDTPVNRVVLGDMYGAFRNVANQGLAPLYPPDVSGWRWGPAWVSAAATLDRIRLGDAMFIFRGPNSTAGPLFKKLVALGPKAKNEQIVDTILNALALKMAPDQRKILIDVVKESGGAQSLKNERLASLMMRKIGKLVFGSPEYQLC